MPQYDAQLVRGTDSLGTSERLATRADQNTSNNWLSNIYSSIGSILGATVTSILGGINSITGYFTDKYNLSAGYSGVHILGAGAKEDAKESSTLEVQTNTNHIFNLTEVNDGVDIAINNNPNPSEYNALNVSNIIIDGYNLSEDALVRVSVILFKDGVGYWQAYQNTFSIGSANYEPLHADKTFSIPAIIADWNSGDNRFGYVKVESLGVKALSVIFSTDIIIYGKPFKRQ